MTEAVPLTDVKSSVTVSVNGRSIEAQPGELLIEVAERAGRGEIGFRQVALAAMLPEQPPTADARRDFTKSFRQLEL